MRHKPPLTLLCLILLYTHTMAAQPDWKTDAGRYIRNIPDYEGLAMYLTGLASKVAAQDMPELSVVLAWAFAKLNDTTNENIWIREHLGKYHNQPLRIDFFKDAVNIEITNYIANWTAKYPLVLALAVTPDACIWPHKPAAVAIQIELLNQTSYALRKTDSLLAQGVLNRGLNTITLPDINLDTTGNFCGYMLELTIGSATLKKSLCVHVRLTLPENLEIVAGKAQFKDKKFRAETIERIAETQVKYFDRHYFIAHSLPYLLAGTGVFAANALILHSRANDARLPPPSAPWYRAGYSALNLTAIGISLNGVVELFNSFKTRIDKTTKTVKDDSAAAYNAFLQNILTQAEKQIAITISLDVKDE